jgi:chemotaxis protein CheD
MGRLVVDIGEYGVTSGPDDQLVTRALGSCLAVCLWDDVAGVAGLLHFLLPASRINPERAALQPAAFADSGIPLLFESAYKYGLDKRRTKVRLVGGADIAVPGGPPFDIGKRNLLAARALLWRNGVLVSGEAVGGHVARTVNLWAGDGRLEVRSTNAIEEL